MADFYREHKSDRFEFIAFHDDKAKTLDELDARLKEKKIAEKHWGGKALPFPILLDKTGETVKKFEITSFPTTLVIDPDGKLVGEMQLSKFRELLAERGKGRKRSGPMGQAKQRMQRR